MRLLLIILAAALHAAPRSATAKNFFTSGPCYVVATAIVSDSARLDLRRIVTSGVRRAENARTLPAPQCMAADRRRSDALQHAITVELGADAATAHWVNVATTDSTIAGDHLRRLARASGRDSLVHVVHLGPDTDLVALPPVQ